MAGALTVDTSLVIPAIMAFCQCTGNALRVLSDKIVLDAVLLVIAGPTSCSSPPNQQRLLET